MENINLRDTRLFKDVKECIEMFGLKIIKENNDILTGFSMFEASSFVCGIYFTCRQSPRAVDVLTHYTEIPANKVSVLPELLNHFNRNLAVNHFYYDFELNLMILRSALFVTGELLDKKEFRQVIEQNLATLCHYIPVIKKFAFGNQSVQSIIKELIAEERRYARESSRSYAWDIGSLIK